MPLLAMEPTGGAGDERVTSRQVVDLVAVRNARGERLSWSPVWEFCPRHPVGVHTSRRAAAPPRLSFGPPVLRFCQHPCSDRNSQPPALSKWLAVLFICGYVLVDVGSAGFPHESGREVTAAETAAATKRGPPRRAEAHSGRRRAQLKEGSSRTRRTPKSSAVSPRDY